MRKPCVIGDPCLLSRTGYYEGVMIDDHLGVQLLSCKRTRKQILEQPAREQQAFAAAERAYDAVGLEAREKRRN